MKKLFSLVSLVFLAGCASSTYPPLDVVEYVDIQKYQGKWYEIARLPNSFQEDCYCSSAEYKILDSTTISVRNECREDSIKGNLDYVNGKAFVVEGSNNAKLKVQFFWPFKGDYWIIDLDRENYQYAVIGAPSRKYLWILARTPKIDKTVLDELINSANNKEFDTGKLIYTDNGCSEEL